MPWSIAAPVIGAVASSALSDSGGGGGGGAGSSTQSKEPWAPLQPWILGNAITGQNLQTAYTNQPFSALQNQAYANQNNQSAYMRALVPSLLGQLGSQQLGYDRSNQNARPKAFDFNGLLSPAANGQSPVPGQGGLLAMLANGSMGSGSSNPAANTPQVAPPPASTQGTFMQQPGVVSGMNNGGAGGPQGLLGTGGYGTFRYGMEMPQPGTPQYRDMSEYFNNGGSDPNNYYGRAATNPYNDPKANPLAYMWTSGIGGSPAGGGIGDTGANAAASASGNTAW